MTTKVKGLLKGLRYISQIFDEKEEDEIQIGFPTDVKHVAHIGTDGPSANAPSWMSDFKGASDVSSPTPAAAQANSVEAPQDSKKNSKGSKHQNIRDVPKSRHHSIDNNNTDSPKRNSDGTKHARRHRSSDPSSDSSGRGSPSGGSRRSRRLRNSNLGPDSPRGDGSPPATKPGRRRKTKTASIDDSERAERSSRRSSKGNSMTDISLPDLDAVTESGHGPKDIEE